MKAIGKYIVLKKINEELKTSSGILLTNDKEHELRYDRGIVIKVGTDVTTIKDSDEVYYDKYNTHTMIINDEQVTICQERDIVVVV